MAKAVRTSQEREVKNQVSVAVLAVSQSTEHGLNPIQKIEAMRSPRRTFDLEPSSFVARSLVGAFPGALAAGFSEGFADGFGGRGVVIGGVFCVISRRCAMRAYRGAGRCGTALRRTGRIAKMS